MIAIFIAYNQAYNEEIIDLLDKFNQRGFTRWDDIKGRGSVDGLPHYGNHAWPVMNHALLTMVEEHDKASEIIAELKRKDDESPNLGLRAFTWEVNSVV